MKKIKNKTAKGILSLGMIIILLVSVLTSTFYFNNGITANAIKENFDSKQKDLQIKEVDNLRDLNQLNEGWYQIRNGFVFYLEHFDFEVPLWIRVRNDNQQNGMFVVDVDGNVEVKKNEFEKNHLQNDFFSDEF